MTQPDADRIHSINPATGEIVGTVDITPPEAIPGIIAAARAAQHQWAALGAEGRRARLAEVAQRVLDESDRIGALLTAEMGKPLAEARGEVRSCGGDALLAELREMAEALATEVRDDGRTRSEIHHDPFGVCAAITPWNFPFAMPHWMVLPALMAGNAVILKPSEETPLIGQAYAELFGSVLPEGVLQVVHGADAQGRALVSGDVDLIAFTGSRAAGKHILGAAAGGLKRVILELGGKDPLVVLDDLDADGVAKAAKFAARNSFRNAGQVCVSTERIYVPESIADDFVDRLAAEAHKMVVGDGACEGTRVGPMINARQAAHVRAQVAEAVERGAIVAGRAESPAGERFVGPVVLDRVTHEMSIAREETFGPVACVVRVADEAEAVRLANDTPYGLGAIVWGADGERAAAVARQLTAGMIGINQGVGGAQGTPWVGARESGYGFHGSVDGHRQFAQTRVLSARSTGAAG